MTPRFESLQAPLDERRKLLEAAVDLYEFYHYHDMELNWINERLPIAHSTNRGKSLDVAQSLLQKHKVTCLIKGVILAHCISPQAANQHLHTSPLPSGKLLQAKYIATLSMSTFTDSSTGPAKMVPVDWDKSAMCDDFHSKHEIPMGTAKIVIYCSIIIIIIMRSFVALPIKSD